MSYAPVLPIVRLHLKKNTKKNASEISSKSQNFLFKIPAQVRACTDSRRDFWTTNWKSTVLRFYKILQKKSPTVRRQFHTCAKFPIHFQRETSRMR